VIEVFGFGKAPLAISARCYHARVHKLSKDNCKFVCEQDPDGLRVKTMDGQDFLSVNGVQTLSHGCVDVLDDIQDLVKAGVRALRLSPQNCDMVAVAKLYREVLDGRRDTAEAENELASLYPNAPFVNGFLHALPGAVHAPLKGAAARPHLTATSVKQSPESPRHGFRVVGGDERGNHGEPVRARREQGTAIVGLQTADRHHGFSRQGAQATEPVDPERRRGVFLGLLRIDRANAEIIGGGGVGAADPGRVSDRKADDFVRPEEAADVLDPHVALPDMQPIGVHGERDVEAIIDDQSDSEPGEPPLQRPRFLDESARGRGLFAQLHQGHAAARRGLDEIGKRPAARQTAIGDEAKAQDADVERHQRARRRSVMSASPTLSSASRKATRKLPGRLAFSAAISPAIP